MPPKKNVAPSNAVRQFWCEICKKGYPRQPDYENHLRSYDHNHRQRLADMKKITAQNETESRKRGAEDMRPMPLDGPNKKPALGSRFSKVGNDTGSSRFKKVGANAKNPEDEAQPAAEPESELKINSGAASNNSSDTVTKKSLDLEQLIQVQKVKGTLGVFTAPLEAEGNDKIFGVKDLLSKFVASLASELSEAEKTCEAAGVGSATSTASLPDAKGGLGIRRGFAGYNYRSPTGCGGSCRCHQYQGLPRDSDDHWLE